MEYVLLGLIGFFLVVIAPILGAVAFFRTENLKRRLADAETVIGAQAMALAELRGGGYAPPPSFRPVEPEPVAQPVPQPAAQEPAVETPAPTPAPARSAVPTIAQRPEPPAETPPPIAATKPARSFESDFGERWVVWVGAVALILGGVFLVRYSIEQGLIGPAMRIAMGALFAAALLAGGEFLRRRDLSRGAPRAAGMAPDVPAALTAAGTATLFGVVYAAHALYDFISPAVAFLALGAVGLATMVLAGLHGPLLGALGLLAAFAAPFLVSSDAPNPYVFPLYATVVTAAAFALAWVRGWPRIAEAATALSVILTPIVMAAGSRAAPPVLIQSLLSLGVVALFVAPGLRFAPARSAGQDLRAAGLLAAFLFVAAVAAMEGRLDGVVLLLFLLVSFAAIAIAILSPAVAVVAPAAALFAIFAVASLAAGIAPGQLIDDPLAIPEALPEAASRALVAAGALGALFGLGGLGGVLARRFAEARPVFYLAASALAPIPLLALAYAKTEGFIASPRFGIAALLLALLYAAAAEMANRARAPRRAGMAGAAAILALGGIATLALALALILEKVALTLAFAALPAAIAFVYRARPLPALRVAAAVAAVGVFLRIVWDPAVNAADAGAWPVFNWILVGYGTAIVSMLAASHLLKRRRGVDRAVQVLEALALTLALLMILALVRHAFGVSGWRAFFAAMTFPEAVMQSISLLAYAFGLSRLRAGLSADVLKWALVVGRVVVLSLVVLLLVLAHNPWFTRMSIGGHAFFNWALVGYGGGAALAALIAWTDRSAGRRRESLAMLGLALVLAFIGLNTLVASAFRGPAIGEGVMSAGELYAYSAVWLAFGLALLGLGAWSGSRTLRLASAAIVAMTVLKVFLIDMSELEGLWRALSFIGLGLVLLVVGRIYQRVLGLGSKPSAQTTAGPGAGPTPT